MRLHRLSILLLAAACDGSPGPRPPASEFLVAAGDSTFWITSGKEGVTVRGAPIALARFEGRLYELYVTDDDRSYYDAVMIGQRLYRRDLVTGDSAAVVEDSTVATLAAAYARAHPAERRLQPHESNSDDPDLYATADLEIVGVHGPYLSFEHHSDIGLPDGSEVHTIRRGVVDLRDGKRRTPADLFGRRAAEKAAADARLSFSSGIDSLLAVPGRESATIARVMRGLRFDPTSFSVVSIGPEPAVVFLVPGDDDWATDLAFPMAPIRVPPPGWWAQIKPLLTSTGPDSAEDRWESRGTIAAVIARYDTLENLATLVLRDSAGQEWKAAQVPPPVDWVMRLDFPPLDTATRRGLRRAFDDAALYSEDTRIAALPPRSVAASAFRDVALRAPTARTPRRHRPIARPVRPVDPSPAGVSLPRSRTPRQTPTR
jgi:hypothetical protein